MSGTPPPVFTSQSVQGYLARFTVAATSSGIQAEIGETTDLSYTKSRDMLDATSHAAAGAKIKKPGLLDWTGTVKGLHLAADAPQLAMRGALDGATPLYVTIYPSGIGTGLDVLTGACYIKDLKWSGNVKDLATAEFSLEGCGFLTESTQSA